MENLENLKTKNVDVFASLLTLTIDNNKLLATILDVLVDMHRDGKSEDEKKAIHDFVNERMSAHLNAMNGLLVPVKKQPS